MRISRQSSTTNPAGGLRIIVTTPGGNAQSQVSEQTPFQRFDDLMGKLLAVPKEELDEKRAEYERKKKEKRAG